MGPATVRSLVGIVFVLLALPAICVSAHAAEDKADASVRTIGEAVGLGPGARHEAAQNALKAAVAQQLESWIPSRNLAAFAPIIDHAADYVHSYDIVKQETTEESTSVEVEARLETETLRRTASVLALQSLIVPARIAILSNRGGEWDTEPLPLVTQTLGESLKGRRFEQSPADELAARFAADLSIDDAAQLQRVCQIGRELLADMVICCNAQSASAPLPNKKGVYENYAVIKVKVIRTLDGLTVEDHEAQGKVLSVDTAQGCRQAMLDACARLPESILRAVVLGMFMDDANESVFLTIENPGSESRVEEIAKALKSDWQIESVDTLYNSATLARLKVRYAGPILPLSDYFLETRYSDFHLDTRTVIDRDLTLVVDAQS